jgi:adenine-specific DNA-methyltransferase
MFYPVWINPDTKRLIRIGEWLPLPNVPDLGMRDEDGNVAAWPIRKDGTFGRWGVGRETLNSLIELGYASAGRFDKRRKTWAIYYLSAQVRDEIEQGLLTVLARDKVTDVADVAYVDLASRRVRTVWHRTSHDAGANGTDLIKTLLGGSRKFPFPKSLYAVEDALRVIVRGKPQATILDFFAGSGTTAHAVMRLNRQDAGSRQCISVTNNEVAADEQNQLREKCLRPGDTEWEKWGICDYITKPRIEAAITGLTPDGEPVKGDYKFTDEFPLAQGFEENAAFLTLSYEAPVAINHNLSFKRISSLLWMRAGSEGRRIDTLPKSGWEVADTYGLLVDLDQISNFYKAIEKNKSVRIAYIVTNDDRRFQAVARRLPETVEAIRLYESYLSNFRFSHGE